MTAALELTRVPPMPAPPVDPNLDFREGQAPDHRLLPLYTTDLPDVHDLIADLRRVADRRLAGQRQ